MKNSTFENLALLRDPKTYLENFCRIKGKEPGQLAPFILKECQKDLFNTIKNYSRIILLKARQLGMSTAVTGWIYHNTIMNPGTTSALIGYNTQLTAELLDKVKTFYRSTPNELKPTLHEDSKWAISFPRIDSKILVLPSTENVGVGYTLTNVLCLSGKTNVFKKNGEQITIDKLNNGDFILNGCGSYSRVNKILSKQNSEEMIKLSVYGCEDLVVTKDHLILARERGTKGKWKKASDLTNKDYLAYPYFQLRNIKRIIKVENRIKKGYESRSFLVDRINLTRDFGEFCGWYISEGTFTGSYIALSINKNEVDYVVGLINKSIKNYISSYRVYYSKNSETATITIYGSPFSRFINEYFGNKCQNKKIDDRIWRWSWNFSYGLLKGIILGDGMIKNNRKIHIVTTSPFLANNLKRLLVSLRLGLISVHGKNSDRYGKQGKYRYDIVISGKGNYKIRRKLGFEFPVYNNCRARRELRTFPENNQGGGYWKRGRFHYWGKVKKIKIVDPEQIVYDIFLDDKSHSFVANGVVVHNCTELSRWENQEDKMTTLESSVPINGRLIVESTPRGVGNYYHRLWVGDNDYVKKEYGWRWGYTDEQIETIRRRINNPLKFAQDYELSFLSSGLAVFNNKKVEAHRKNILKVGDTVKDENESYKVVEEDGWRIYKKPNLNHFYVCGVDPADGVEGGDYSVAIILDRTTGEEVAFYRRRIPQYELAKKLNEMGRRYNNALMVVEMNSGATTMLTLKELLYPNPYFRQSKMETLGQTVSDRLGWRTTHMNRSNLINDFDRVFRENSIIIHSEELLNEMLAFVYDKNGDPNAEKGYHDDSIFAISVAIQGFKVMYHKQLEQVEYWNYLPKSFSY